METIDIEIGRLRERLQGQELKTVIIPHISADGSAAGLFFLNSNGGLDYSYAFVGTRITFYGEPALPAAPATLELNDEDYEQLDSIESEENWF